MKYEEKIMKLFKNGYLTTRDVTNNNIPKVYLTKLVRNDIPDEMVILQNKSKNAIYSNTTALFLHKLSNRLPIKYDISVLQSYKGSLQKNNNVNLFYIKKELLNLGVIDYKLDSGYVIKVYDLERTICDIIKNRKKLDQELVNKAIREYFYSKNKNTIKLYDYAKQLNIYDKVRNTFEVLK